MERLSGYEYFMSCFHGIQIYCPNRFILPKRVNVDFIKSGVYDRYKKLVNKRKLPLLIRNWFIALISSLIPTTGIVFLIILFPICMRFAFWLFIDGFLLTYTWWIWLEDKLPRRIDEIKLKRKPYNQYF